MCLNLKTSRPPGRRLPQVLPISLKTLTYDAEKGRRLMSQSRRWDPSRRFIAIFILIVIVLLALGAGARPIYRAFKHQRAQGMADEIDTFLQSTNLLEAGRLIRVAITLDPKDPRIARQAAEYLTQAGSPDSLNYWEVADGLGKATREDRVRYIRICLDFARLEVAQNALKDLLLKDSRDVDALELSVRLLQMKGDMPRARLASLAALALYPLNEQFQFLAGALLSGTSTNIAERAQGRRLLWGLAVGDNPQHDAALALLSGRSSWNVARMKGADPDPPRSDKHIGVRPPRCSQHPCADRSQAPVGHRERNSQPSANTVERPGKAIGGRWLLSSGAPLRGSDIVPESVAGTNSALVSLRLEAMAARGELDPAPARDRTDQCAWESGTAGMPPRFGCQIYRAGCGDGRPIRRGESFGGPEPGGIPHGGALRGAGWTDQCGSGRRRHLMGYPAAVLQATRELVRLADGLDDLRVMRDAIGRVAELVPSDPAIVGRLAVLQPAPE